MLQRPGTRLASSKNSAAPSGLSFHLSRHLQPQSRIITPHQPPCCDPQPSRLATASTWESHLPILHRPFPAFGSLGMPTMKEHLDSDRVNYLVWRFVASPPTRLALHAPHAPFKASSRLCLATPSPIRCCCAHMLPPPSLWHSSCSQLLLHSLLFASLAGSQHAKHPALPSRLVSSPSRGADLC